MVGGTADHYRIVNAAGVMLRRRYPTLEVARRLTLRYDQKVAAMSSAGKVLRYHPVDPKAKT